MIEVRLGSMEDISFIQGIINFYFLHTDECIKMINNTQISIILEDNIKCGVFVTNRFKNKVSILIINKKQRRRGLGKILFEEGCKLMEVNKSELKLLATYVDETHPGENSVPFWEKIGFVVEGEPILTKKGHLLISMKYVQRRE